MHPTKAMEQIGEFTTKLRLRTLFGIIVIMHVVGWGILLLDVAPGHPTLFGTSVLAYSLGLRHAFDADHIAAIDDRIRVFLRMRHGEYDREHLKSQLLKRRFISRFAGRFFDTISPSWQMYPLGILFGLDFDTTSEIAQLALAAGAASSGRLVTAILVLPLLFASGMCLLDTADGAFMAYLRLGVFNATSQSVLQSDGHHYFCRRCPSDRDC